MLRALDVGGAERQAVALARGLAHCHTVVVVTFYEGGGLASELEGTGVFVVTAGKKSRWDTIAFGVRLIRLLRRYAPDVIYSYLPVQNISAVLLKWILRLPVVCGIRGSRLETAKYQWPIRVSIWLERWFMPFADAIIVNSSAGLRDAVRGGMPPCKIKLVTNGIDTVQFSRDVTGRDRVRREWKVHVEEKLIGVVARIDPMKGHRIFLRAAALLAGECATVRFVCVGDGLPALRAELVRVGVVLGLESRLIWAEARADMAAVYSALDVLCSPSEFGEGFSNVIGEAMACGVACVVTDVGHSAEIVGELGTVVVPSDSDVLARALRATLERDTAGSRDLRRGRIATQFGVDRMSRETREILEAVLPTACLASGES